MVAGAGWLERPERERQGEQTFLIAGLNLSMISWWQTLVLVRVILPSNLTAGASGKVFSVDIQPEMLAHRTAESAGKRSGDCSG